MLTQEFVLEVAHRVHYSNKNAIPISEIASSLLALERILLRSPKLMTQVTGVPIERAEVYVEEIASGSLTEDVFVKLFFRNQEELDAFLLKINEKLGQHKVLKNALLAALILTLVGTGLLGAAKILGADKASKTINVNNNTIINIAAKESGLTPEQLEKIVQVAISDKKANARDAIEFVRPAKRDKNASISLEDSDVLIIPKEVVSQAPSKLVIEDNPTEEVLYDVDLQIRATNLDSHQTGWAGIIPSLVNRRVKLVLGEDVDLKDVAGKFVVRADVIVHRQPQGEKREKTINKITIMRIVKE